MTSLYGYKFASQFGEKPHEDWVHVLTGVTGRQMADGLNECLDNYPEWPPGAAQFRALCLGIDPKNIDSEGNDATWQLKKYEAQNKRDAEARKLRNEQPALLDQDKKDRTKQAASISRAAIAGLFGKSTQEQTT